MHFHTQKDQNNLWYSTLIDVPDQTTPYYQLYNDGMRFKFASAKHTVFWGCICEYYTGVWLLRNKTNTDSNQSQKNHTTTHVLNQKPIIPPITSADIERFKSFSQVKKSIEDKDISFKNFYFQYFAEFFARQLTTEPNTVLHTGKWQISQGVSNQHESCYHNTNSENRWSVYSVGDAFRPQLNYINWMINGSSELLALKDQPNHDEARVKWWRKKVKEQTCPPVLAMFVSCLDAYIIIDGHSRLLAYQLETEPVNLLILAQYMHIPLPENIDVLKHRLSILRGLKQRLDNHERHNTEPNMDDINQVLIDAYAYDNGSYLKYITTGKAISSLTDTWKAEVIALSKEKHIDSQHIISMITGKKII